MRNLSNSLVAFLNSDIFCDLVKMGFSGCILFLHDFYILIVLIPLKPEVSTATPTPM